MDKLRMLALSFCFPPMAEPRAIQVSRLLEGLPASVVMICGAVEGSTSAFAQDATIARHIEQQLERVIRVPFHRPKLVRYLDEVGSRCFIPWSSLPDVRRSWVARVGKRFLQWQQESGYQPDVLVTFAQPMSDHLFGLAYKRRTRIPWIAHFSDPWADDPFRRQNRITMWLNRRMERQVLDKADAVLFTSPEAMEVVLRKYPASWREKAFYLPHCYDPADFDPALVPPDGTYILRFAGTLYNKRTPRPLYEAIERIGREIPRLLKGVSFEFVGASAYQELLNDYPVARQTITHHGTLPHAETLRLMQTAHCLLVIDAPADVSVFFPSKLVEYLAAKRFILALTPSGICARAVKEVGGLVADPGDITAVTHALRRVLEQRPKELPSPTTRYEKETVANEFMSIVETVVQKASNRSALGSLAA